MKNKILCILLLVYLCSACAPSPEAIQKAIEETQKAAITNTPVLTSTATQTPLPTSTPKPTITLTPNPNYILETGFCIMGIGIDEINGNPADEPGCGVQQREQIYLDLFTSVDITTSTGSSSIQIYCAIFTLNGTFMMFDMDTTGSGKVNCHL